MSAYSLDNIVQIIEPGERLHALDALRELSESGLADAAADALRKHIATPIYEWIGDQPLNGRIDIEAGLALAGYADDLADRFETRSDILPEYFQRLDDLWREFQDVVGYGAAAAIVQDAAKRRTWQTAGGKSRKGKVSPFKAAVLALAQRLGTRDAQAILDAMRADTCDESELLDDLRARRENPVMLRFQEVPEHAQDDEQKILFVRTDNGEECTRAVKTMKNYLKNYLS